MYHIYCNDDVDNAENEQVVTPDFNDAQRQFNRLIRDYPDALVTCDKIENTSSSAFEIMSGDYNGRRVRVMFCDPEA